MNDMIMSQTEECFPVVMNFSEGASCPLRKNCNSEGFQCDFSAVDNFPLAMSYVPMQRFCNLYPEEKALCRGTVFEDLDFPFKGERGGNLR